MIPDVGLASAFGAGLLSFLSPCILPIVPFYICYLAGVSLENATAARGGVSVRRLTLASAAFALGVTTVFVALGASATLIGQLVRDWFDAMRWVAAAVILLFGLHFLGVVRIPALYRSAHASAPAPVRPAGAYLAGLAFAFGWTPCVGPVLAAILFAAGAQATAAEGVSLLLAYALGMTAPFVLAAPFVGRLPGLIRGMRRYLGAVEKTTGGALVLFAGLIATNSMGAISGWMLSVAPDIGTLQ